jgi:hypothetical protein
VSNHLEYLREMTGKWHLVERWIDVDGEYYKFTQDRDTMIVTDHMGAAFAKLSTKIEGKKPPEGYFWLKWWSENEQFWQKVSRNFEVTGDKIWVSDFVTTQAARLLLAPPAEGSNG